MSDIEREVDQEMERRYGFFRGEHPDRAKVRQTLETEPMARWLARREIRAEILERAKGGPHA